MTQPVHHTTTTTASHPPPYATTTAAPGVVPAGGQDITYVERPRKSPARGVAYSTLMLISLALAIAAAATRFYTGVHYGINPFNGAITEPGNGNIDVRQHATAWRGCTTVSTFGRTCGSDFPSCQMSRIRALRAFQLLTIIFAFFALITGIVDLLGKLPQPLGKFIMALLALMTFIWSLIAWALAAALYTTDCAGTRYKDLPNARWGPSGPLLVVVSILSLIATLLSLLLGGGPGIVSKEQRVPVANDPHLAAHPVAVHDPHHTTATAAHPHHTATLAQPGEPGVPVHATTTNAPAY